MPDSPIITHPLLRLGRLALGPGLHGLPPGSAESGLVVTAMVAAPDAPVSRSYAWDVAWADAVREASQLGADPATAQALERGAGAVSGGDAQVVVAANGEAVLTWRLPPGVGASSVRVGPLPHLREVADAAARRPSYVVVLADRDGTDIVAHVVGDQVPARRIEVDDRPGLQHDPHPDRPPAQHHGERHATGSEPESGGQRNAEFIAARVAEAADSAGAHIVLGAGDQHILEAIAAHLPETVGPVTAIAGGRASDGLDDHLSAGISAALEEITGAAIDAIGNLVSSLAEGPSPAAVRGIKAVAQQLAEQQVAVLLVSADLARDAAAGSRYRIGGRPAEFLVDESDTGVEVPLDNGLVWAARAPGRDRPATGRPFRSAGRRAGRRATTPRIRRVVRIP